jgi:hypothetical protein
MAIYFFLFALLAIFSIVDIGSDTTLKKVCLWCLTLLLILVASLRYLSDNDYINYLKIFWGTSVDPVEIFNFEYFYHGLEKGFVVILWAIRVLEWHSQFLFFFCAFWTLIITSYTITRISNFPIISLFVYYSLFYLLVPFTQIRYGLAMSLLILSFYYYVNRKIVLFIILILLSFTIHVSSISGFVFIIIYELVKKKKTTYIVLIISFCISFIDLTKVIGYFMAFIGSTRHFQLFIESNRTDINYVSLVLNYISFIPFVIYRETIENKFKYYNFLNACILSYFILAPICERIDFLSRLSATFAFGFVLLLPTYLLLVRKNAYNYALCLFIIFLYCAIRFISPLSFVFDYKIFFYYTT